MIQALATDLDGTFLPLPGTHRAETVRAFGEISELIDRHRLRLLYATGRSLDLTLQAVEEHDPPRPEALICDVGTSLLYDRDGQWVVDDDYANQLAAIVGPWDQPRVEAELTGLGLPIKPQKSSQQSRFKTSFDFEPNDLDKIRAAVLEWLGDGDRPLSMTISIDPFTGGGLLDLLPRNVDKGFAIAHWIDSLGMSADQVIYAGDSGNDTAAVISGTRAIVVGNAHDQLLREAQAAAEQRPQQTHLYFADARATAGVAEGMRHYLPG